MRIVLRVIHDFLHAGYVSFKPFTRLHAKEIRSLLFVLFIQECKDAKNLCLCILASLHPWPLLFPPSHRPSSSYRNNLFVCISITFSKVLHKGFGITPDCGAGSMTEWKIILETIMCLPSRSQTLPNLKIVCFEKPNRVVKRILGSINPKGHFLSGFTQFSLRSLRYEPVTAWHFSFILKRFLKWTSMNRKDFYSIVHHCAINGCDCFSCVK